MFDQFLAWASFPACVAGAVVVFGLLQEGRLVLALILAGVIAAWARVSYVMNELRLSNLSDQEITDAVKDRNWDRE
jgi:hypothetical protein